METSKEESIPPRTISTSWRGGWPAPELTAEKDTLAANTVTNEYTAVTGSNKNAAVLAVVDSDSSVVIQYIQIAILKAPTPSCPASQRKYIEMHNSCYLHFLTVSVLSPVLVFCLGSL
jgi:hypothetical protein